MPPGIRQAVQCLCAGNALPFMQCSHLTGRSVDRWAKHVTAVGRVITCVMQVGSQHSHVKGPFVSCSTVLVARAGVKYPACVQVRERAGCDYSGKFPLSSNTGNICHFHRPVANP